MKKKIIEKTLFCCQWQSKLESRAKILFIYLFIFKNKVAVLRVQLITYITLSQQNLGSKLLKIYKKVMSFVGLNKNQLRLAT